MTQQSRILLILSVFAVGGVSVLAMMASRYGKLLEENKEAQKPATRVESWRNRSRTPAGAAGPVTPELMNVDRFIRVRRGLRATLDSKAGTVTDRAEFESALNESLRESGVTRSDYTAVRALYRDWRVGKLRAPPAVASAFEARRTELEALDLGRYEELDS